MGGRSGGGFDRESMMEEFDIDGDGELDEAERDEMRAMREQLRWTRWTRWRSRPPDAVDQEAAPPAAVDVAVAAEEIVVARTPPLPRATARN